MYCFTLKGKSSISEKEKTAKLYLYQKMNVYKSGIGV